MQYRNESSLVLVVEDDLALCRLLEQRLREEGWAVQEFHTSREGCQYVSRNPVDLVILDWALPDGDGRQLLRQLRAAGPAPAPPVLVISGHAPDPDCLASYPVSRVIAKPFDIRLLLRHARRALRPESLGMDRRSRARDAHLASEVGKRLRADPELRAEAVEVGVRDGIVTLRGRISSASLQGAASKAALAVTGVRRVHNRLKTDG